MKYFLIHDASGITCLNKNPAQKEFDPGQGRTFYHGCFSIHMQFRWNCFEITSSDFSCLKDFEQRGSISIKYLLTMKYVRYNRQISRKT